MTNLNWLLLIDTAIQGVAVGLSPLDGEARGELVWSQIINSIGDSARLLPMAVEEGLSRSLIQPTDIAGIVISTGPGSFTGLRVGLAYAMGLAAGIDATSDVTVRWHGRSSVSDIADSYKKAPSGKSVLVALSATKTAGYAAFASSDTRDPVTRLLPIQVHDDLTPFAGSQLVVIGDWPLLETHWPAEDVIKISPEKATHMTLQRYAEVGFKQWPHGFVTTMPAPNYLRKSSVEEKEKESSK